MAPLFRNSPLVRTRALRVPLTPKSFLWKLLNPLHLTVLRYEKEKQNLRGQKYYFIKLNLLIYQGGEIKCILFSFDGELYISLKIFNYVNCYCHKRLKIFLL